MQLEKENKENVEGEKVGKCEEKKIWTNESTLILINLIGEFDEQFQTSIKKYVWMKISQILSDKLSTSITWQQCDTKWKGLLKIYKDIKEHNLTSGKNRRRWEYFEVMNEILHKKPEITPVATCSNMKGLTINKELSSSDESIHVTTDDPDDTDLKNADENKPNNKRKCSIYSTSFSKKRLRTVNIAERRHQEKMERQDKFLNCFEKYIDIIGNMKEKND